MENKHKVEAVLFAVGKEISTERLASLCELKENEVNKVMKGLIEDYTSQDNSLMIIQRENNWKLTVKDEYTSLVNNLVTETDLDKPLMETLAVIAWKYPVVQSEIIKLRHSKAYDHIKQLLEMGFVQKIRSGRTYKLKLTKKFFEYFDLPSAEAKKAFLKEVPEEVLKEAEETEKEAGEVEMLLEQEEKEVKARDEIKGAMAQVKKADESVESDEAETESSEDEEPEDQEQTVLVTNQVPEEAPDLEGEEELEMEGDDEEGEEMNPEEMLSGKKKKKKQKEMVSQVFG